MGIEKRSIADVRTKWTDLRSRTKAKASKLLKEFRKTGGGEVEEIPLTIMEEKLLSLTHAERKVVKLGGQQWLFGIDGGVDTADIDVSEIVPEIHDGDLNEPNNADEIQVNNAIRLKFCSMIKSSFI